VCSKLPQRNDRARRRTQAIEARVRPQQHILLRYLARGHSAAGFCAQQHLFHHVTRAFGVACCAIRAGADRLEIEERRTRKIERLLKAAALPPDKTLATLDTTRWSPKVQRQLPALCSGEFLDRAENLLVFGLPGRGKTHLCAAIGYELVRRGRPVHFTSTAMLVQRLLRAKRDLVLERELDRLDHFDAVVLDDIGYVQQERDEMEVLFTFLAARYERKSVMI
jgi:DNA replication protein DnaC